MLTDLALGARGTRAPRSRPGGAPRDRRGRSSTRARPPRCSGRALARSASTRPPPATGPVATACGSGRSSDGGCARRRCCFRGARARSRRRASQTPARRAARSSLPVARRALRAGEPRCRATSPRSRTWRTPQEGSRPRARGLARAAPRRGFRGEELVVAGAAPSELRAPAWRSLPAEGVRVLRSAPPERVPRAAAARARVRVRASPRGLRDRPAGGAGRRLHARHARLRPVPTRRCRSRARSTRGSWARISQRRCARRSTTPPPGYAERALRGARAVPPRRGRPARRRAATAAPACRSSRAARASGRVLATSSAVSHARRAVATPQRMFASVRIQWASESIRIRRRRGRPRARGRRTGRGGRGWR